jgi:hypothetical protein
MTESDVSNPEEVTLPLRDRVPEYLTIFALGWLGVIILGLLIGAFSEASVGEGMAYVAMGYGVVLLLAGGATGGGYTNLGMGAAGTVLGSGQRHDDDFDDPEVRRGRIKRANPRERLRRGLRPEKNPRAFWQVIAGFAYLAGGIAILEFLVG